MTLAQKTQDEAFKNKIYKLLKNVTKPSRYTGREEGSIQKDWDSANLRTCLLFPDMYEVAISNLGHRIFYHIINNYKEKNYVCDRVYAPAADFKEILERENIELYGIDYFKPLKEFDVHLISLQYELSYPTILAMLKMANIPIKCEDRAENCPIILAGGPGCYNPEGLADFIDVFVVGDGENVLIEVLNKISELKNSGVSRKDIISQLETIDGVYVPVNKSGKIIKKRVAKFEQENSPTTFPVPFSPSIHDRAVVEIRRGCGRMCRFCQSCFVNLPVREREPENIIDLVGCTLKNTGYEEYSLLSLSSNDYDGIEGVVKVLNSRHSKDGVSLSLPSQRADKFSLELAQLVQSVRKSTLTFAPEAGSQRLRDVINKNLTEEQVFDAVMSAYKAGWQSVKLYFMIGLPTETTEDLDEIINLLHKIKSKAWEAKREFNLKPINLTCTISIFVPKPFTPFQWCGQNSLDEINTKIRYLKDKAWNLKGVKLNFHESFLSRLEAVFAKGDRKLGQLIETAFSKGSYLDAWNEYFNKNLWLESATETGIDFDEYSTKTFSLDEKLPWDFIDTGVKKEWLVNEYKKAMTAETSEPCDKKCSNCGVCSSFDVKKTLAKKDNLPACEQHGEFSRENRETYKYRLMIAKKGVLKFISHLDFQGLFYKAVKKCKLDIAFTQGFNPGPKISVASALGLFFESEGEYIDMELYSTINEMELIQKLNSVLHKDCKILTAKRVANNEPSVDSKLFWAEYEAIVDKKNCLIKNELDCNIKSVISKDEILFEKINKKGFKKQINIRPSIHSIELEETDEKYKLKFILKAGQAVQAGMAITKDKADNTEEISKEIKTDGLNKEATPATLKANDFLKILTPDIDWEIKRNRLLNRDFEVL